MIHLIQRFGRDVILKRNPNIVTYIDGYAQTPIGEVVSTIKASVQPATPEDLEALPEGSDTKEAKKIYSIEKLFTRQGDPVRKGDFLEFDGDRYEIFSCENHTDHTAMNIFYYKSIAVKVSYDA